MKILFYTIVTLNLIWGLIGYLLSPEIVAIHFNAKGVADDFTSSVNALLFMSCLNIFIFLALSFFISTINKIPKSMINLPNKDHWLNEKNEFSTRKMINAQLHKFGSATYIFILLISILAVRANFSDPIMMDQTYLWSVFTLYIFYIAYWLIMFVFAFKKTKTP